MDLSERAKTRSKEMGRIGAYLLNLLREGEMSDWPSSLVDQSARVNSMLAKGVDEMVCVSCVVLLCNAMIQIRVSERIVLEVMEEGVCKLDWSSPPNRMYLGKNKKSKKATYPSKSASVAQKKANLRFGDVYVDTCKYEKRIAREYSRLSGYTREFTDDQATAVLLASVGWSGKVSNSVEIAIRMVRDPTGAKECSTVIKSLGLNSTRTGAMMCEGNTLLGRGVGELDLERECKERIGVKGLSLPMPTIDPAELRASVREVIRREIGNQEVVFPELDDFWSSRWLWCVNGSHSRAIEEYRPDLGITMEGRVHRRVAAEEWDENPMKRWKGEVAVSASEKQEHGKTRLILACDTVSYVGFEHLLRPIEKVWRNEVVLLDPGQMGHSGISERVLRLGSQNCTWLMLDYDDFNSQHSLGAQAMVIDELCKCTRYPKDLSERLVESFYHMGAYVGGVNKGRFTATLMSGHRGTTVLNSILNEAYIRCSYGRRLDGLKRLHTGDDVVIAAGSFRVAEEIIEACKKTGLRMNPMKQSVGTVCAEFLRMAIRPEAVRGYLCRSIASAVSGNWVNQKSLDGMEHVRTMVSNAHTMRVRSNNMRISRLMETAMSRRVKCSLEKVRGLLSGRVALGDGPCFTSGRRYRSCGLEMVDRDRGENVLSGLPHKATATYLAEHVSDIEKFALVRQGLSPVCEMIDSSYGKTLSEQGEAKEGGRQVIVHGIVEKGVRGIDNLDQIWRGRRDEGLLSKYPILNIMKNRIKNVVLLEILIKLGWDGRGKMSEVAWGSRSSGAIVEGAVSYSDACHACRLANVGVVKVTRPVYV